MLLDRIEDDGTYCILIDGRNPLRLLLVRRATLQQDGPVEPLWHRDAADARSFDALVRWAAIRRDRWQEWGQLAECLERPAFYAHMRQRMNREPPAECIGTVVQRLDHPAKILIGESLRGPQGLFTQPLCIHRFKSSEARDRFQAWLSRGDNIHELEELVRLGYSEGAIALGEALDERAAKRPTRGRAERRRRVKAVAQPTRAEA